MNPNGSAVAPRAFGFAFSAARSLFSPMRASRRNQSAFLAKAALVWAGRLISKAALS